ncbi:MAG: UDP-2,3-diacylglucosamine diphosphatase LpxI [Pseudomonadota bacterium]
MAKVGIIAGRGDLPATLARCCEASGRAVFVMAFEGQTNPDPIRSFDHAWGRLGAAGEAIQRLKSEGVTQIVMAGGMTRPSLAELKPDLWTIRALSKLGFSSRGDDGLLGGIVKLLESEGFELIGADDILQGLLAESGCYGAQSPDEQARDDIQRGVEVARALGQVDVGQAVVVQQGLVLGVEAVEGTDALLTRCKTLRREGLGGVLVKMKKPNQERRVDLPTVGLETVERAHEAGLRGIAVEAGGALVLNREGVARLADAKSIFVMGIAPDP